MEPIISISKTPEELADSFALQLIGWIKETPGESFHLVLSGGKTPSLLFSILAEKYGAVVPWQKIHFWWGDERMVSPEDPESNFGVVKNLLFNHLTLSKNQIHRIKGEEEPAREAKRYGDEIAQLVPMDQKWPVFDLIMLGLGDDGHTASIFPDQMQLLNSHEITGIAIQPQSGQKRITLTGKVLNNAKKVAFLVTGTSKSLIFNQITHDSNEASNYPASHIHPKGALYWFVDEDCVTGQK